MMYWTNSYYELLVRNNVICYIKNNGEKIFNKFKVNF